MKYLLCLMVLALICVSTSAFAVAYTEQWEMNADLSTVAGTVYGNTLTQGTGTDGNGSHTGFTFAGGIGTFLDNDTGPGGDLGYFATGSWGGKFTLDMSVRDLAMDVPAWPGKSKDFSFKGGGQGRGLQVDDGAQFVNGSGVVGTGGDLAGAWGDWVQMRVTVDSSTNTATLYDWRGAWTQVAQTSMGGSGWASELSGSDGFGLGSLAGSSTNLSNFQIDYARVYLGSADVSAVYDLYAPPVTPEPGSLLALGSGLVGLAGFVIRRRRA